MIGYCGLSVRGANIDLGFNVRNIMQTVSSGVLLPDRIEILRGSFELAAADAAVKCLECPAFDRAGHRGIPFYSWSGDREIMKDGEGNLLVYAPPIFDRLSRVGRVMVQQDYVFRTLTTSRMEALIDARLGHRGTLKDVEEFRLLAHGLSQTGAYMAFLTGRGWELEETLETISEALSSDTTPEQLERFLERLGLEQSPMLRPYQTWATGIGKDNNGHYMLLVLVHANTRFATENATLLPRRIMEADSVVYGTPWRDKLLGSGDEFLGYDGMEVATEGRILMVKALLHGLDSINCRDLADELHEFARSVGAVPKSCRAPSRFR